MQVFQEDADYLAFMTLLEEGRQRTGMRILSFCLMPNHWHMVLWPKKDGDLAAFLGWVSTTHVRRWRQHRETLGAGHLYQGRFKSFPVQRNEQLYRILRYVEGNPRRAQLATRAQTWPFSSLYSGQCPPEHAVTLSAWPVDRPADWPQQVNKNIDPAELNLLHLHVQRSRPFGTDAWIRQTAKRLDLEWTIRDRGRPRKTQAAKA